MRIIAVDDEVIALKNLELKLKECDGGEIEFQPFQSCTKALDWLTEHEAEVALLDIHLGNKMDGITLAKKIRECRPSCDIIFLTGYSEHAVEAFAMKVSGYLLKPVSVEALQRELDFVRNKRQDVSRKTKNIRVQCFGNFEVFVGDRMLRFSRRKSKELFAYLIDRRGASVTMAEIASVLWADGIYDRSRNNQIHSYLHDLSETLKRETGEDLVIRKRNALAVDVSRIDCDYLRFLAGDAAAVNSYVGEYMSQYWWAEFTTGTLTAQLFE